MISEEVIPKYLSDTWGGELDNPVIDEVLEGLGNIQAMLSKDHQQMIDVNDQVKNNVNQLTSSTLHEAWVKHTFDSAASRIENLNQRARHHAYQSHTRRCLLIDLAIRNQLIHHIENRMRRQRTFSKRIQLRKLQHAHNQAQDSYIVNRWLGSTENRRAATDQNDKSIQGGNYKLFQLKEHHAIERIRKKSDQMREMHTLITSHKNRLFEIGIQYAERSLTLELDQAREVHNMYCTQEKKLKKIESEIIKMCQEFEADFLKEERLNMIQKWKADQLAKFRDKYGPLVSSTLRRSSTKDAHNQAATEQTSPSPEKKKGGETKQSKNLSADPIASGFDYLANAVLSHSSASPLAHVGSIDPTSMKGLTSYRQNNEVNNAENHSGDLQSGMPRSPSGKSTNSPPTSNKARIASKHPHLTPVNSIMERSLVNNIVNDCEDWGDFGDDEISRPNSGRHSVRSNPQTNSSQESALSAWDLKLLSEFKTEYHDNQVGVLVLSNHEIERKVRQRVVALKSKVQTNSRAEKYQRRLQRLRQGHKHEQTLLRNQYLEIRSREESSMAETVESMRTQHMQEATNLSRAQTRELDAMLVILQKEDSLQRTAQKMKAITSAMVDPMVVSDEGGTIRMFNTSAEDLFGHVEQDVIGQNIGLLMPEQIRKAHPEYIRRYLETGQGTIIGTEGRTVRGITKSGEILHIFLCLSVAFVSGRRLFIANTCDNRKAHTAAENRAKLSFHKLEYVWTALECLEHQYRQSSEQSPIKSSSANPANHNFLFPCAGSSSDIKQRPRRHGRHADVTSNNYPDITVQWKLDYSWLAQNKLTTETAFGAETGTDAICNHIRRYLLCLFASNQKETAPVEVVDNIFVGSLPYATSRDWLNTQGITHIVSAFAFAKPLFQDIQYKIIQILDTHISDISQFFQEVNAFIASALEEGGTVLIHCFDGVSCSPSLLIAYLIGTSQLNGSYDDFLTFLREKHPEAQPNPGFKRQLSDYAIRMKSLDNLRYRPSSLPPMPTGRSRGLTDSTTTRAQLSKSFGSSESDSSVDSHVPNKQASMARHWSENNSQTRSHSDSFDQEPDQEGSPLDTSLHLEALSRFQDSDSQSSNVTFQMIQDIQSEYNQTSAFQFDPSL